MSENKTPENKKAFSVDWLLRGSLTRIGDIFDRFTGRKWTPSSSLATSELIERLKKLLDSETKDLGAKGKFVPHNLKLKMQWDKFSTDAEDALKKLEHELLTAVIDYINDNRFHTYAPLKLEIKPDYFIEGVKLFASFDEFADEEAGGELNVTVTNLKNIVIAPPVDEPEIEEEKEIFVAEFTVKDKPQRKELAFAEGERLSVGRTKENALGIDDASVSKVHAALVLGGDKQLMVADTGSTNGTFINGERIAYGKAFALREGDKLKFGTVEVSITHVPKEVEPEAELETEAASYETVKMITEDEYLTNRDTQIGDPAATFSAAGRETADSPAETFSSAEMETPAESASSESDTVDSREQTFSGAQTILNEEESETVSTEEEPNSGAEAAAAEKTEEEPGRKRVPIQEKKNEISFLFADIDWQKLKPENLFGGQVLERTPAGLSIVYIIGVAVLLGFLAVSFFRSARPHFAFEENLPKEVKRKLSSTITNRSLRIWQFVFVLLALTVFGFHVYWTYYARENNEAFDALNYKDLRNRRTTAARLRGWMLDRTGKLSSALAYYKVDKDGTVDRAFALEKEMAHLLGTERGTPGLERTLYKAEADPMPEAWEILTKIKKPEDEQRDVRVTLDRDLQAFAAQQLQGKKGAVVALNPQTGDVLAMYSNPSFSLGEAETLDGYLKLEADKMNKPLLSRATREYYVPGSTFKTLTMISAFRAGKENLMFPDLAAPECYTPFRGSRPICDAGGSCEICSYDVPLREAYKVSSNQYFAQLANALGRERMRETAQLVGIAGVDTPDEALTQGFYADIWNASNKRIANSIAPTRATMVTGPKLTLYDFGLEGMGQGLAGQMTPFQMALIAAAAGNLQGKLMKPRIEADIAPQVYAQVLTPQQSATVREIMSTVTEEAGGTGGVVRSKLSGTGIATGGKTGTAEKQALVYDQKTGKLKTVTKKRKNAEGDWVEYQDPVSYERTDGWFICIAPLENPQIAIAVVIEDIGSRFGGQTAAPVAADMILKARELGLLGEQYKPKTQTPTKKKKK